MQGRGADEIHRVVQRHGEYRRRALVGVVIEEEETQSAGGRVRVVEGRGLQVRERRLLHQARFLLRGGGEELFQVRPGTAPRIGCPVLTDRPGGHRCES
jgi:hypothetical protein